jgi:phage tail sheath protein FI
MLIKIVSGIKGSMGWAISEPNTPTLRSNVGTSVNNYLRILSSDGELGASSTAICNSTNNSAATIAAGYLYVDVMIEFLYPADKIVFRFQEKVGEGITVTGI